MPSPANGDQVLEQRVHRLEDAVAALQDTRQLEERVVERVVDRIQRDSAAFRGAGFLAEPRRPPPLPALGLVHQPAVIPEAVPLRPEPRQLWGLSEAYLEVRAMLRIFFDPRFQLGRWVRLTTFGLLAAIATSGFWLLGVPGFVFLPGWLLAIVAKVVDLVLAYFLFKVLTREARRYRSLFPDRTPPPNA